MENLLNKKYADWTLGDMLKTYGILSILITAIWKAYELIQEYYTDTIEMAVEKALNNTK